MTKAKGRPAKRRLADMAIHPREAERYSPPPFDEYIGNHHDFARGIRMHQEMYLCENRLVEWSVCLSIRTDAGWAQVVRIDVDHDEVHMHQYRQNQPEIRTIFQVVPEGTGEKVLDRWFDRAKNMMENEWRDYLGTWRDDPE
jgi:hypothetical protein